MRYFSALIPLLFFLVGCGAESEVTLAPVVYSPDSSLAVEFISTADSGMAYAVRSNGEIVVDTSQLGFEFREAAPLVKGLNVEQIDIRVVDEEYELPWGEQRTYHNHCQEMKVALKEVGEGGRKLNLIFRVFNDGVGFRYEFPAQEGWENAVVTNELTEFRLVGDPQAWWIPGDWDSYEHLYQSTRLSEISALTMTNDPNLVANSVKENAVNTPVTFRYDDGLHLSIHEANLTNYSGMTLRRPTDKPGFECSLVPAPDGSKASIPIPFATPWRTIQISPDAAGLLSSRLILHLNDPTQSGDFSWIQPTKYVGIWWEMHLNKSSWDLASGKHGATTAHAKELIDFAAANQIGAMLVEGWNTGWERWIGFPDREGVFDFVTPYPDYDLAEVVRYGKEKGIELIMHHETSAAPRTYEQQLDTAYALMQSLGIHAVKTGYVGPIIPEGEHHHGQWMVRHYRKVAEHAAAHQVAVNIHEPIKATGLRRTWPNIISREGLRGQEFNAWAQDGGNPPDHLTIVPFTRGLAGPIDYTPGIFHLSMDPYKENDLQTTLVHQLALYVVIYSPIQMAADLIEYYEGSPAFQFIRDVGVDWEQSVVLEAEIGEVVVMAREEKETGNWFVGGITGNEPRSLEMALDFLGEGEYEMTVYRDGEWALDGTDASEYAIEGPRVVRADEVVKADLAKGGGVAISLIKK